MAANDTESELLRLVREQWKETGKATLLSFAGARLSKAGLWPPPGPRQSLLDFVRLNLSNQLRIERWPEHELVHGLFPIDAELDGEIAWYFGRSEPPHPAPRYRPAFWAAFAKPILNGRRRFLDLNWGTFEDLPDSQEPTRENLVEIAAADVPDLEVENREKLILQRISDWAERSDVDKTKFYLPQRKVRGEFSLTRSRQSGQSLMDKLFDALSDRDLVRIQMPLDIVAKLRRYRD